MSSRKINIGLCQFSCEQNRNINFKKAEQFIRECSTKNAQIIVLPELFTSLYFCDQQEHDNFQLAEAVPGPSTERLSLLAKELKVVIVASLFEKRTEGIYHNTCAVIDADGSYLGKYRKMHIPDDPGYYEKFYFTPGDLGYKIFQTKYAKIGVLICWDQWYPEAARINALKGAELLVYPTAIGWAAVQDEKTNSDQLNAWQCIQRSHSIANGLPVVSVNRTGKEGEMQFWGNSFVSNAFGKVIIQASAKEEKALVIEVDLAENNQYRIHWPFLRDRRIDSYGDLSSRFIDEA